MEEKEFRKKLSDAIEAKKVVVGLERTLKFLEKGQADLVAVASNCPKTDELKKAAGKAGAEFFECRENNIELGELCRKTFRVSTMTILKR